MIYRTYGRGSEKISEIGFGGEHLEGMPEATAIPVVEYVVEKGINIIDIFMSNPDVRSTIGKALKGQREKIYIQGHLCSTWKDGQYERTRKLDEVKASFDDLLTRLQTDYIDFGMLHFIDTEKDFEEIFSSGAYDYALELKKQGVIKRLGFSSHNPAISQKLVEAGEFDIFLFSINAAYDLDETSGDDLDALIGFETFQKNQKVSIDPLRSKLYNYCENNGIGITVMKGLGAGRLLQKETSPFGKAMSVGQCIKYALDRPGVLSILLGLRSKEEVDEAIRYYDLSESEKDYSEIVSGPHMRLSGKCMYCNHCLPCPVGIDIAAVNKYLDLATVSDSVPDSVQAHYDALSAQARDCIECGQCEERCPFDVPVRERMHTATNIFGK